MFTLQKSTESAVKSVKTKSSGKKNVLFLSMRQVNSVTKNDMKKKKL